VDPVVAFEVDYSLLDRLIHRIAFSIPALQLTASDIETRVFGRSYKPVRAAKPIFVTSLPRAGTTLLLEVLSRFPSLATHTYRDMPFVMAPILWSRLSRAFRKDADLRERAHGDDMNVGYDSPEAFEEILWRAFWPEKYHEDRIQIWTKADAKDDARSFFFEHMKKIIALRCPQRADDGRYLSKNNANIARLDLITSQFPDAMLVVPFRAPIQHAASLHRQHRNFLGIHRQEPFALRYMEDIGHYEFGVLHRPIAFPELFRLTAGRDALQIEYWIAYWIAAYEYVLVRSEPLVLVSYEGACANGESVMSALCARLKIAHEGAFAQAAAMFRSPDLRELPVKIDSGLRDRAEEVHSELLRRALGR